MRRCGFSRVLDFLNLKSEMKFLAGKRAKGKMLEDLKNVPQVRRQENQIAEISHHSKVFLRGA
jgi:hypothetical protein